MSLRLFLFRCPALLIQGYARALAVRVPVFAAGAGAPGGPTKKTEGVPLRHAPGGIPKGGPQAPSWSFQIGRVQGGEENEIFPSLVSFSLPLSFGQAKERGYISR